MKRHISRLLDYSVAAHYIGKTNDLEIGRQIKSFIDQYTEGIPTENEMYIAHIICPYVIDGIYAEISPVKMTVGPSKNHKEWWCANGKTEDYHFFFDLDAKLVWIVGFHTQSKMERFMTMFALRFAPVNIEEFGELCEDITNRNDNENK